MFDTPSDQLGTSEPLKGEMLIASLVATCVALYAVSVRKSKRRTTNFITNIFLTGRWIIDVICRRSKSDKLSQSSAEVNKHTIICGSAFLFWVGKNLYICYSFSFRVGGFSLLVLGLTGVSYIMLLDSLFAYQ